MWLCSELSLRYILLGYFFRCASFWISFRTVLFRTAWGFIGHISASASFVLHYFREDHSVFRIVSAFRFQSVLLFRTTRSILGLRYLSTVGYCIGFILALLPRIIFPTIGLLLGILPRIISQTFGLLLEILSDYNLESAHHISTDSFPDTAEGIYLSTFPR